MTSLQLSQPTQTTTSETQRETHNLRHSALQQQHALQVIPGLPCVMLCTAVMCHAWQQIVMCNPRRSVRTRVPQAASPAHRQHSCCCTIWTTHIESSGAVWQQGTRTCTCTGPKQKPQKTDRLVVLTKFGKQPPACQASKVCYLAAAAAIVVVNQPTKCKQTQQQQNRMRMQAARWPVKNDSSTL